MSISNYKVIAIGCLLVIKFIAIGMPVSNKTYCFRINIRNTSYSYLMTTILIKANAIE